MRSVVALLRGARIAVGFLTRIPVGDVSAAGEVRIANAVPWFPLVGAVVGLAGGGIWRGLSEVLSAPLAAALTVGAMLLITGAFHHDGLADMADAFGGGWTVEQRFEILKDSRLGTYGTSALVVAVVVEVLALAEFSPGEGLAAMVAAHGIGRAVAVTLMLTAPVARDGMGAAYIRDIARVPTVIGVCATAVLAAVVSPVPIAWPLLAAVGAGVLVTALAWRKIGGITGDVLGAATVLATLASLVVTAALV